MDMTDGQLFGGRYRLISEKGRGAFGEVWLAHDEQIDMDVAIKIYIALDARGIEEFKSEYKNAYSLNHPNLLHAYHFDIVDRRPFLVMPYCPGSAEALVGATDERVIWRFIRDVANGLSFLHSKNILHRDIKPDNILVDKDGNFVITDFGVSTKMKSTLRRNSTRVMSSADISGTIGYMAPELFSKTPEAVKATDIWAFGATLFEIINQELPFFGQGGIMLVSGAEIPELKGAWSRALQSVVQACLAKETWDRPTAEQIAEYATDYLNGNEPKAPWKVNESAVKKTPKPKTSNPRATVSADARPNTPYTKATTAQTEKSDSVFPHWSVLLTIVAIVVVAIGLILGKDVNEPSNNKPKTTYRQSAPKKVNSHSQQAKSVKPQKEAVPSTQTKSESEPAKVERNTDKTEYKNKDNAALLKKALAKEDYKQVQRLANSGYAPAYAPLAKYYLRNHDYSTAETYARKAEVAGFSEGAKILKTLDDLGYND